MLDNLEILKRPCKFIFLLFALFFFLRNFHRVENEFRNE